MLFLSFYRRENKPFSKLSGLILNNSNKEIPENSRGVVILGRCVPVMKTGEGHTAECHFSHMCITVRRNKDRLDPDDLI